MCIDSLAENTPEFICPICRSKPKYSEFQWKKASLGGRSPWQILSKRSYSDVSIKNIDILPNWQYIANTADSAQERYS